ncbi:MAG: hypothetical protein HY680_05520 [Chloroflexi bacterium]|nr:hypothetical protein [Chloroflexota bacterium]
MSSFNGKVVARSSRRIGGANNLAPRAQWAALPRTWVSLNQVRIARATAFMEIALTLTGLALSLFMLMHLGLLFSILLGRTSMDALARFLERYFLLQIGASFLVLFLVMHVMLVMRKVPTTLTRQWAMLRHMRAMKHWDTWTWAFQGVSGIALLVLVAIHIWVVLTDLPVQSAKSGERVFQIYLWFYIPLVVLVESHLNVGLYRAAAKWHVLSRRLAHPILLVFTGMVLGLGVAILVTFYRVGASLS